MIKLDNALDKAHVYHDMSGLHSLRSAAASKQEKVEAGAKQFESMMVNLMLKSMREANDVFAAGNMLNSKSTRFYEDMLHQQLSLTMTRGEGIGLASMLADQLNANDRRLAAEQVKETTNPEREPLRQLNKYLANGSLVNSVERSPRSEALTRSELDTLARTEVYVDETDKHDVAAPQQLIHRNLSAEQQLSNPEMAIYPAKPGRAAAITQPLQFDTPQQFISTLLPAARQVASELGVEPQLLLAQAALETGWGKHMISEQGKPSYNLFGIKADAHWHGDVTGIATSEYRDGIKVNQQAQFRSYASYNESFRDYLQFLQTNGRYQQAIANPDNPRVFAKELQTAGYATDPDYAVKILRIYNQLTNAEATESNAVVNNPAAKPGGV